MDAMGRRRRRDSEPGLRLSPAGWEFYRSCRRSGAARELAAAAAILRDAGYTSLDTYQVGGAVLSVTFSVSEQANHLHHHTASERLMNAASEYTRVARAGGLH